MCYLAPLPLNIKISFQAWLEISLCHWKRRHNESTSEGRSGKGALSPVSCLEEIDIYRLRWNGGWDTHWQWDGVAAVQWRHFRPGAPAGSLQGCGMKTLSLPLSWFPCLGKRDDSQLPWNCLTEASGRWIMQPINMLWDLWKMPGVSAGYDAVIIITFSPYHCRKSCLKMLAILTSIFGQLLPPLFISTLIGMKPKYLPKRAGAS